MHHSGCFERWRIPIATAVTYPFGSAGAGGDLTYHLPGQAPTSMVPAPNCAIVLDADTIFHQVEQVAGSTSYLPDVVAGAFLTAVPSGWSLWSAENPASRLADFGEDEVRFSMSWKGYCFSDEEAFRLWAEHEDDLRLETVMPVLRRRLEDLGALQPDEGITDQTLAGVIVDTLIPFPPPAVSLPSI